MAPFKKSRIITLTLTSDLLSRFPRLTTGVKSDKSTSLEGEDKPDNVTPIPVKDEGSETPQADGKKKKPPPNPNARKRAPPAIDPDAPPRDRARPGPKKRAKTDGADDKDTKPAAPAAASHKLGPKANTGAINAGLRALDRSGKPCRRWERKGFQLKSFTGEVWNVPTWKGSQRPKLNADGEVQSDTSSSDSKPLDASEQSASALGDTTMMNGIESSPAPIAA